MRGLSIDPDTGCWMVRYTDETGRRRKRRTKFRGNAVGRDAAQKLRSKLLDEAERRRHGLADPSVEAVKRPMDDHLAEFETHLKARDPSEDYLRRLMKRLRWGLRGIGAQRISDITEEAVDAFLVELREAGVPDRCLSSDELATEREFERDRRANPKAPKTRDDYLDSLRAFSRWLSERGRLQRNPLASLKHLVSKHQPEATSTFVRRPLTVEEFSRLVDAAIRRGAAKRLERNPNTPAHVMDEIRQRGEARAFAYLLAGTIGVRVAARCALRWEDLDLESGTVTLKARHAKNRREARPHLPEWLVDALRQWKGRVATGQGRIPGPADRIFGLLRLARNLKRLLDKDLAFAGIEADNAEGRIDCHALRTSAATQLYEVGVDPKVAARLLNCREDVMQLRYARLRDDRAKSQVNRVPAPEALKRMQGS